MSSIPIELPNLSLTDFKKSAALFAAQLSKTPLPSLYGVTDGKRVGTFVEAEFKVYLTAKYTHQVGNAARGIDFPGINVDLKVTSRAQPQSSCPFNDATQKIYGLGYDLLVFVYEKRDDSTTANAFLDIQHVIFIESIRTADSTITRLLLEIINRPDDGSELARDAKVEEIDAVLQDKNLPLDDVSRRQLAERLLEEPPQQGSLTISNALQWRLQYSRAINLATSGALPGVEDLNAK
ncbi:restriction endonuclease [Kineococcus sp. SYSU DK003]|uniref:restriction endonuclease n=1 Tax=Kineococcus sp. SYSU DK003 TaxID=3383124 RepID=UPI003D7E16CA